MASIAHVQSIRPTLLFVAVLATIGGLAGSSAFAQDSIELFEGDAGTADRESNRTGEADAGTSPEESVSIEGVGESGSASGSDLVPGRHERTITLSFEKRGKSILVPATVDGKEVYFLFDTGASYTSLNPAVVDAVNADPPEGAPSQPVRTANGRAVITFGILERLRLDRKLHRNVTFGLCRGCPSQRFRGKPVAGLLGLNVLNRYEIDIDSSKGVVEMTPNAGHTDRRDDVEPWIAFRDVTGVESLEKEGRRAHLVRYTAVNRSPRRIDRIELDVACRRGRAEAESVELSLEPGERAQREVEFQTTDCPRPQIDVTSARW